MKKPCLIHSLAQHLTRQPAMKAVWLDPEKQQISVACQPGRAGENARKDCAAELGGLASGAVPVCPRRDHQIVCEGCVHNDGDELPGGIRLVPTPGSGVLLEKADSTEARRRWRWHILPLQFEVKHLDRPATFRPPEHDHDHEHTDHDHPHEHHHDWKVDLAFAAVCGLGTLIGFILEKNLPAAQHWVARTVYAVALLSGAWHPAQETWQLLRKRILDVHFLMLCVAVGAVTIGHWWEGALLLFLFSLSGALEELAMDRTEREIASLFKSAPKVATLIEGTGERKIPVEQVAPGMTLRVRPGEQFAVDAEVVSGASAANESNLTGESVPVEKAIGDTVLSGTLNLWGSVDCRVVRPASESALAKIIRLIQDAQDSKAPSQKFTDKFGTGYTWFILAASTAMFLFWWLARGMPAFHFTEAGEASAFYRAMTLLVVASPCALVLSIPSAILAGIASAARRGILFRGGSAIEELAGVNRVAMDKTGTLTTGELEILAIETVPPGRENELAQTAAALGHHSTHPISRALAHHGRHIATGDDNSLSPFGRGEGRGEGASHSRNSRNSRSPSESFAVENFRSLTGLGVEGSIAGAAARMGRRSMFENADWLAALPQPEIGVTETLVERGDLRGRILLRDSIRAASAPLLRQLTAAGLHVTMLTGDRPEAAAKVAAELGLTSDQVRSGLKPEQKVAAIHEWIQNGERVAMIGDGVNDAPSLAAAHVAVGMGMRGSDAVLEQADVVLMQDKLENFNYALELSRHARKIIRQNLAISLGTVVLLVVSAIIGTIPLPLGVVGHEGSTVVVVLNSLRLLFFKQTRA